MTETQRAAMKTALEALEWSWGGEPLSSKEHEAMQLLRAALAEPLTKIYQVSMAKGGAVGAWIDVDIDAWQSAAAYPEYKRRIVVEVKHD